MKVAGATGSHHRPRTLAGLYAAAGTCAVLAAAGELGVLEWLDAGPIRSDELGLDPNHAVDLLGALSAIGVVEPTGGGDCRALLPDLCGLLTWLESWSDIGTSLCSGQARRPAGSRTEATWPGRGTPPAASMSASSWSGRRSERPTSWST